LRTAGGVITSFDPPGSRQTMAFSINASDTITGHYFDTAGSQHGFLRAADGSFTTFDPPGAVCTYAYSINALGEVTGSFQDGANNEHGYLRSSNGAFTTFDVPGSLFVTRPVSLNANDQITGYYGTPSGVWQAFLRLADG